MKFYGELLIFILLFITNARILFMKKARRDPLVSLAPLSFILSILQIFAWGIDYFTLLCLFIAFLVLLSNFHALFRYSEHLYVDHYSILMKIWSFFTMILAGTAIFATIYFHPIEIDSKSIGVTEIKTQLNGSFRSGFNKVSHGKKNNATIYEFTRIPDIQKRTEVILFIPDKRGDTYNYRPFIQYLTKEGFTVFSGDFYSSDCRWTHTFEDSRLTRRMALTSRSLLNNQKFMAQREYYAYNISLELNQMYKFITEKYGSECRIILISDVMGNTACQDFMNKHSEQIISHFELNSIPEYKSAGYGFIAQTDPVTSLFLKIKRDDELVITKKVVAEMSKNIKKTIGIKVE